jgi:hypothetical protein
MKKIISIILATTLALVLALGSLSCAASSASTTTPPATTPPTTTPGTTTPPAVIPGQEIAEEFIKNSATFQFDGIEGSIKLIKDLTDNSTSPEPDIVLLSFEFQTAHPGHGDRTGQVLAQVVTFHTVTVQVDLEQEKVISGVCDKVWDMVEDKVVVDEPIESLALGAIETSETFKFDGITESLKVVNVNIVSLSHTPSPGYCFTIEFQTRQPGHGDRTGEMLAQVITNHSAVVVIANGKVLSAICDETYDLLEDRPVPITVSGIVIEGGDTTPADGPQDAPRVFVYKIQKDDGTFVNVSYTAYPPSPEGERERITLDFHGGSIQIGDYLRASGAYYDEATNTITVAKKGDYIMTYLTEEKAREIAAEFIKNSPTFQFDGIEGSIKFVKAEPGWTSSFMSTVFTFEFQTAHPGHGDRTGQILAQVITDHTAVVLVNMQTDAVPYAVCDGTWDMVNQEVLPEDVSGIVIEGGDTTPADGPQDTPRVFVYKIQKDDGTFVNVSYTAYPPSPMADEQKFNLELHDGVINTGDRMQARGMYDAGTNTVIVAEEGDYIRTFPNKINVEGIVIEGGDTTAAGDPEDNPRVFIYKIQKDDGSFVNVSYTVYPPSSSGEDQVRFTLSLYDESGIKNGDLMKAYGTYDMATDTVVVADEDDFIKVEYIQR